MNFLKIFGVVLLVFLILGGGLVSFLAWDTGSSDSVVFSIAFLKNIFKDPLQAVLFVIMVLLVILFLVFLFTHSNNEEEPEELLEQLHPIHIHPTDYVDEDEEKLQVTYPTLNFESEQPSIEAIHEKIASTPNEPEFKRFLKNTVLELEREKARIYHEVAFLDEDYRKGILTETEFLTGIQLILEDKGLEETIEEKDRQIEECKTRLAEIGISKKKKQE
ncbi:MAG: hypothetical protein AABX70_01660 [Nanoarchaeota archaeon]